MRSFALLGSGLALALFAGCDGGDTTGSGGSTTSTGNTGGSTTSTSSTGGGMPGSTLIQTDKGPVQGVVMGNTRAFLGIPYAAAPVGPLRWKPPQPAAAWTAPLDASKKGPWCPQLDATSAKPTTGTSEDCLTINVWTPLVEPAQPAPVMVWIHGGGFTLGSGAEATYDGQKLAEATGAVVITLNYRLGPLGFLAHAALESEDAAHPSTGMYGFEDQRAALAWAKANAGKFGGDPAKITLFGESAGGISTCLHLVSPKSQGLFQRAILESGPCGIVRGTAKDAEPQGDALATALGCTDPANLLACLRGKTADEVLTALPNKKGFIAGDGASWLPSADGFNVPELPDKLLGAGSVAKIPVILGTNKNEGALFLTLAGGVADEAAFQALMEGVFPGHGAEIVAKYPVASFSSATEAAGVAFGDGAFVCPTRRTARWLAKAGASPFLYHFVHAPTSGLFSSLGAFHSVELPFVFGNAYLGITLDADEQKLSQAIQGYWSSLASDGTPKGAKDWPLYAEAADESLVLDLAITTETGLNKSLCDFWDSISISP
jgi:para-nitrobenzyl esterase